MSRAILAAVVMSLLTPGCGEDAKAPAEAPPPPPFVFEREFRVLPVDFGERATVDSSPVTDAAGVGAEFPQVFMTLQPWDELHERSNPGLGAEAYAMDARLATLREEAAGYGSQPQILAYDLLTRARGGLWCLPEELSERQCKFDEVRYLNATSQFVYDADQAYSPALIVAGTGMNKFAGSDPTIWSGFVTWFTGTVAGNVDSPVTTAIDWEAFVADCDARQAQLVGSGEDPEAAPALAHQAVWKEQFVDTAVMQHMPIVAIRSRPTVLRVSELPDDYYSRLIPLIPTNKPVAFLPVAWTNTTPDASTEAVKFLKRFRHLVAGLNVTHVAWARLVDIDSGRCPILENLGVDRNVCNDGLLPAAGPPKSLWDEFLDESDPGATSGE